jgi:phospholipase/carboxylesterase
VQGVLRTVKERYAPDTLAVAGFSQGAMLALDVALAAAPAVDRVAMLSGALLADSISALRAYAPPRPPVLVSHGRADPVLPFAGGERVTEILTRHGFDVAWHPFDGGHEIPRAVVDHLRAFLFAG